MSIFFKSAMVATFVAAAGFSVSAANTFIIDVDDASRIKYQSGQTSASYVEYPLQNGENTITQTGSEDFVLTPRQGYLIESITAYEADGSVRTPHGWSYSSTDDSYKIYFLGSNTPAARYVVKTKVDDSPVYTLTINIDNPQAVKGGSYRVGNQTIVPQTGSQTIEYNPGKGLEFYLQLRPSVTEATFTRNGSAIDPAGVMSDGTRTYKFNMGQTESISITTTMETPEYFLNIDDPSHVEVYCPSNTLLTDLTAGENRLLYNYGDRLVVKAKEGYRVQDIVNMSYSSYSEEYSYTFSDGDSGMRFNIVTEEFTPPTADITINLDNLGIVNYIALGSNEFDFVLGDNDYTFRIDKTPTATIYYKSSYDDRAIATLNGEPLEIIPSMWSAYYSEIPAKEGESYRVVVRELLEGDYTGSVEVDGDSYDWTLSFAPAGIITVANPDAKATISSAARSSIAHAALTAGENDVKFSFADELPDGEYTLSVPAGMFTINGAASPAVTHNFTLINTGIADINATQEAVDVYSIDGRVILRGADKEAISTLDKGVYIINGKKIIVK